MISQYQHRVWVLIFYFLINILVYSIYFNYSNAFIIQSRYGTGIHILDVIYRNNHFIKSNNIENDDFFADISDNYDEIDQIDQIDQIVDDLGIEKSIESHKKKVVDTLSTKRIQYLDPPLESNDERYNCLVYLIGIPYNFTEFMIAKWLEDYGICTKDVTFLLEFNGSFTGDAYIRCNNNEIQKKIIKEKHMNHISDRYIEVYPVTEWAYKQYYQAKYFKKVRNGFYTPLETLVPNDDYYKCEKKTLNELRCGDLVIGKISEITDKGGVIKPLNISNGDDNVIFILCNNRLSQNVSFKEHVKERVEIKLILGMEINLYFEKMKIIDKNSDIWDEKNVDLYSNNNINPLNVVYLTMDCNIHEKTHNNNLFK